MFYTNSNPQGNINEYFDNPTMWGVNVPSGTPAYTYGSWVKLSNGYNYDINFANIMIGGVWTSGGIRTGFIDIAYGPDENNLNIIIPYLNICKSGGTLRGPLQYLLPMYVPKNTPILARHANAYGGFNLAIYFSTNIGLMYPYAPQVLYYEPLGVENLGLSNCTGISVPNPSTNDQGLWVEMTASTTKNYIGLMMCGPITDSNNIPGSGTFITGDIGIGPVGQETLIYPFAIQAVVTSDEATNGYSIPEFISIPKNTRVVARISSYASCDVPCSVIVYGLVGV